MRIAHFMFGEFSIFSNFVVSVMNEGITVIPEYNDELLKIANTDFKDKLFGYISYRKNSYSIDSLIYIETSKIQNLAAIAIVTTTEIQHKNVEIEKFFIRIPFRHFTSLDVAKQWIEAKIKESPIIFKGK